MSNKKSPPECIYVCACCGKMSDWRYGFAPESQPKAETTRGWDESCMMHATLIRREDIVEIIDGRVTKTRPDTRAQPEAT